MHLRHLVGFVLVSLVECVPLEDEQLISASDTSFRANDGNALQHTRPIDTQFRYTDTVQTSQENVQTAVPEARKKVKIKIKKKHKKMFMQMALIGILIKSALLPLGVGALKLLTAKAFMMTMMALGLALALTFRSAKEKHVTTEIINLVPPHGKQRSLDLSPQDNFPEFLAYLPYYERKQPNSLEQDIDDNSASSSRSK